MNKSKIKDIEKENKKSEKILEDNSEENKSFIDENILKISTIINALLVIATFFIILLSYHANRTSKESLKVAQGALKLTEQSVKAQIKALIESQKQFNKANRPYLQLSDFIITELEIDKKIGISYNLKNLGNYPARIIKGEYGWFVDKRNTPNANPYDLVDLKKQDLSEEYINKEYPLNKKFTSAFNLSDYLNNHLKINTHSLYVFGDITYVNEINDSKRICSFYVEIFPPPSKEYKIIYTKNKEL